jgi:outer membrane lipoprotein SlyB
MNARLVALAILPATLLSACVTTTTTSTTWGDQDQGWARPGRVAQIRETVTRQEGNPAAGAVAGAVIGGLLGSALGARTYRDRYGRVVTAGNPAGAAAGAIGGAVVGAAASQGGGEQRTYQVYVQFDDGGAETYTYQNTLPFQVNDRVLLTQQGLVRQ